MIYPMKKLPYRTIALFLVISILIIVPFCLWGKSIDQWAETIIKEGQAHPWATGLTLALLLASDIILPIPSCLVSAACGVTLGFVYGTIASFVGMTVSCLAGYAMGRLCTPAAKKMLGEAETQQLQKFQKKYGIWLIVALRPVPVLAEASILFSGIARQPFSKIMIVSSLGNLLVSGVYAGIGAYGEMKESILIAFALSSLFSAVMMLAAKQLK